VHVFVHVRFQVMMWSSDALDPLRRSDRVPARVRFWYNQCSVR